MEQSSPTAFSPSKYFPQRRRALQACANCRNRKTRCDAAKPRCSWCVTQNLKCVYAEAQQPRIEPNTRVLLERIQLLEDRIFALPAFGQPTASAPTEESSSERLATTQPSGQPAVPGLDIGVQVSLSHTASANHVCEWPLVRQLLVENREALPCSPRTANCSCQATDVFFNIEPDSHTPSETWRLFRGLNLPGPTEPLDCYRDLVSTYFAKVNLFFPLLLHSDIVGTLEAVVRSERQDDQHPTRVSSAQYCLLLLVLALAALVASGWSSICCAEVPAEYGSPPSLTERGVAEGNNNSLDEQLWRKAELLLGPISSHLTLEAAQCAMLASLYLGAKGRVAKSYHWAHATAVMCEAIASRATAHSEQSVHVFPDSFRRLYWVSFIVEADFLSEISTTLPSGIARYEDMVPYPVFEAPADSNGAEEMVAFQISTNASIRRFLNRVNSVVYDTKEQSRMAQANYVGWLLRTSDDLWSHHSTVYRNVPDFLLTSVPRQQHESPEVATSPSTPGISGNNPWNVIRLKGRYYAGQYIIHRPFIEYTLLNLDNENFQNHPRRGALLDRCRACLEGCRGFIRVFDVEPANSITCLFATGMVTFAMVIILRISTFCPIFRDVVSDDTEEAIFLGKRNLLRFSRSIKEFEWHLGVLERLDAACQSQAETGYTQD